MDEVHCFVEIDEMADVCVVTNDKCLVERRLTATRLLSKALEAAMMHFNK